MAIPEKPAESPLVVKEQVAGHPAAAPNGGPGSGVAGHPGVPVGGHPAPAGVGLPAPPLVAHPAPTGPGQPAPPLPGHPPPPGAGHPVPPGPGPVPFVPLIRRVNLRRTPATIDPIGTAAKGLEIPQNAFRLAATGKVFGGLQQIQNHVGVIKQVLQLPKLPPHLVGVLQQPDGSGASRVQVHFKPASVGGKGVEQVVLTADDGGFHLSMPAGVNIPAEGLTLTAHGANGNTTLNVPSANIAPNGMIGILTLSIALSPIPVSILAALQALAPTIAPPPAAPPPPPKKKHAVTIGEQGSTCQQSFSADERTDRFPWSLFFRIVEPQMSVSSQAVEVPVGPNKFGWMPIYASEPKAAAVASKLMDRVPVEQPLSVDGFREQIAGIDTSGTFTEDETVPMAASLGLGYLLRMSQQWSFQGLGLGDLVYSLPLAPGEQQQVAIFERRDTTSVQETEAFSQSELMEQAATSDTSTSATFNSAFNEMVNGSSAFFSADTSQSSSNTYGGGGGVSFGIGPIAIGGGASGSSANSQGSQTSVGNTSSALSGSRDATSLATEATHSSASNQAAARVNANRTGMRLASASENMGVTTKTITNHNHTHALTMQYWQVLRMYDVTTAIEGVTLVCLIPMQIVRFMPPGQPATLSDPSVVDSHAKVLARYENILRHMDILQEVVPSVFPHGLASARAVRGRPDHRRRPLWQQCGNCHNLQDSGNVSFLRKHFHRGAD